MPSHSLQLTSLSLKRGSQTVVRDFSLSLLQGEYCVVVGSSGSGKSTLLHGIAGLIAPSTGSVSIQGENVTALAARKRDVALLFQHDTMYPHLTVEQTLRIAVEASPGQRHSSAEVNQRMRWISKSLQLDPAWMSRRPDTLSGGQRRRVALAKTLIRKPVVCLLDEPMAAIDRSATENLLDHLADLSSAPESPTFVHVTHDGDEAMRLADKIVVMDQGTILQTGAPADIYRQPNSVAVALALGSPPCNRLDLEAVLVFCPELGEVLQTIDDKNFNQRFLLVRTEAIRLSSLPDHGTCAAEGIQNGEWCFPVSLVEQRDLGSRMLVRFRCTWDSFSETLTALLSPESASTDFGSECLCRVPISELRVVAH
ncbi:ABC transporter ATP-binding protein [Rhodopirellula sp. JC740]|uniref:ABC transporter ATP-binding protein n=1 Tax=Rhodopirellula halodulae TaxID=2894198 RepID=A0ABS8NKV3_9BACT|nr:ABC transporter ATP-binding protein [Rhodopirellula sp. JC740]MCC9644193.1 ABC transporter ATP-binding protein [Rhodopirellula sp. JC740]